MSDYTKEEIRDAEADRKYDEWKDERAMNSFTKEELKTFAQKYCDSNPELSGVINAFAYYFTQNLK